MTLRFKPFLIAALIASGAASTPALSQSQDAGWFLGAGGGISKFNSACAAFVGPGTCDDNGTYWKVFGGYQFSSNFGYEVGYGGLGELTRTTTGVGSNKLEPNVYDVVLVLTIPFSQEYSVYAKFGLYGYDADYTVTGAGAGTSNSKGRDLTYGFGLKYNITKSIALRMEWQRYFDVGDANTSGSFDVDVGLLGIAFKF